MSQEPAKVHPINGGKPVDSTKTEEATKPERTRIRPNYALPTERVTADKQLVLLRAYDAVSGPTKKPVKINEVADVAKISAATVSMANAFFLEAGLLQKSDAGFLPSAEVVAFALAYAWSPETAAQKLAPAMGRTWFADRAIPKLSMGKVHENELIDDLIIAAGVSVDFRPRIKLLLDFLEKAGIAERDGDFLRKGSASSTPAAAAPIPAPEKAAEAVKDAPRDTAAGRSNVNTTFTQLTGGAVQFNINVKVDMDEFKGWKPERITAFFGGIAAVLSAKAAVEQSVSDE